MSQEIKTRQLQTLQHYQKKKKIQQTYSYSATLALFVIILYVFVQTFTSDLPKSLPVEKTATFELGELKKATYLYSQQPEKNYDLRSPFFVEKLTTTDWNLLNDFQALLSGAELKPFTRNETDFSSATNYLFERKNGEMIFLKSFEVADGILLIDPSTRMELVLPDETTQLFATKWLHVYLENKQFPKWKMVLMVIVIISSLLYENRFRIFGIGKEKPKKSIWINVTTVSILLIIAFSSQYWVGTIHLLFLLMGITISLVVGEVLYKLFKIKPFNWKELLVTIVIVNLLIVVLFM